jgi:dihydropteroate synthase
MELGLKTYVMGILNVTPDSFSDGGLFYDLEEAVTHAKQMVLEGTAIIDIGGESTRPGHTPVDSETEIKRIVPVIQKIAGFSNIPISVDTSKHEVAAAAVAAGAVIINDIWGLQKDALIADVAAEYKSGLILMFNANDASLVEKSGDIVSDAMDYLSRSIEIALGRGVHRNRIMIDPGIGFGVDTEESFELIRGIPRLRKLGFPVLIGPSKKRFIGAALDQPVEQRGVGTVSVSCIGAMLGADVIRVHDVSDVVQALKIVDIVSGGSRRTGGDIDG